jgi:TP901 family phage tail tape measure protein
MKDMIVRLIFNGDASRMNAVLRQSGSRLKSFGGVARREFDRIRSAANSLQGKLAALGMSVGAALLVKQSAELDKSLTRIGQTAGESRVGVTGLRREFFRMAKETGQSVENLKAGFDNAVQAGLNFKEALPVTDAVNKAMAVTGATADQLASGLTVAATAFRFDLARPGQALILLDKMTAAGRQGNAELENLSSIFSRVGVNAARAGMGFDQTLGFIEGLSLLERNPERLSTLADSTLRLFTNLQYLNRAQKVTGVRFFDAAGSRRDPLAVLSDIKKKYDALKTSQQKEAFMGAAFKGVDLDTIKGLQALLSGDMLSRVARMNNEIGGAAGTITRDMKDALDNSIDQTGRLKAELRKTADAFIIPFNEGISKAIKKLLDARKDGGLELSGKQMAAGSAIAAGVAYLGYNLAGPPLKKLLGSLGRTGAGIGEGLAIKYATGVTPVYVVNMPGEGLLPGAPGGKPGGPGGAGKSLPFLAPLAAAAPLYGSVGAAVLTTTTAAKSAADVMRGGSGQNWINEGWTEIRKGIYGDMLYDYMHPEVKNEIKINLSIDEARRVVADVTSFPMQNTGFRVDLNRGTWDNPLGMR